MHRFLQNELTILSETNPVRQRSSHSYLMEEIKPNIGIFKTRKSINAGNCVLMKSLLIFRKIQDIFKYMMCKHLEKHTGVKEAKPVQ